MSHFTVAIIHKEKPQSLAELEAFLEDKLAPFQETSDTFKEWNDSTAEVEEKFADQEKTTWVYNADEVSWSRHYDHECKDANLQYREATYGEIYETVAKLASEYFGYEEFEPGKFGYEHNPNAKWDWWVVGSRWHGDFPVVANPAGKTFAFADESDFRLDWHGDCGIPNGVDSIRIGDIDWEALDKYQVNDYSQFWEDTQALARQALSAEEYASLRDTSLTFYEFGFIDFNQDRPAIDADLALYRGEVHLPGVNDLNRRIGKVREYQRSLPSDESGKDYFWWDLDDWQRILCLSKEEYIAHRVAQFYTPFAVLTVDGQWNERAKMGWWGNTSDEQMTSQAWVKLISSWIRGLDPDLYISMVDCHI